MQPIDRPEQSRPARKSFLAFAVVAFAGASLSLCYKSPSFDKSASLKLDTQTAFARDESISSMLEPTPLLYNGVSIYPYTPNSNPHHHGTYHYFSPYEERFPNFKLTYGFRKTIPYNKDLPTDKQVCFVHVGKAGGSTIGCSLGFSLHCSKNGQVIPNSFLPVLTTHTFHRGVYDCQDDAAFFLFVVRDPLARIMSAFNYDRPQEDEDVSGKHLFHTKEFYLDCPFWTLEEVAQNGLLNRNGTTSKTCRKRAKAAIIGTEQYIPHWFFNYQYYREFIPTDAKILVIRNEHIVEDYNGIERMLGGRDDVMNPSLLPENNVHGKNATDLYLSDESKRVLCKTICNEILFYKQTLRSAANLRNKDVQLSLEELEAICPEEAQSEVCDEEKPDITEKINERKFCDE